MVPIVLTVTLAVCIGAAGWRLAIGVPAFLHDIPGTQLFADYLRGLLFASIALVLILVLPMREARTLAGLWVAKMFINFVVMMAYFNHYGSGDSGGIYWFSSTMRLSDAMALEGGSNKRLVAIAWIVARVTGHSYFTLMTVFSLVGLLGIYILYRAACLYLGRREQRLLWILGLTPSVAFWSSILDKDPLVMLGVGIYCFGSVGWLRHARPLYLVIVVAGIAIAGVIRVWYVPICSAALLGTAALKLKAPAQRFATLIGGGAALLYGWIVFAQQFGLQSVQSIVSQSNTIIAGFTSDTASKSSQAPVVIDSFGSLLRFWPWGAFTAALRPMLWEVKSVFMLVPALESAILVYLVIRGVTRWRSVIGAGDPVPVWIVLLCISWITPYAVGGYGNLGMISRERATIIPIFLLFGLLVGTKAGWNAARDAANKHFSAGYGH